MSDGDSFTEFIGRIRAGDEQAAAELVRRFEPVIRRTVRLRLTDPGLCRTLDSVDVCQSVLASFFVRAAAGQYDLDDPEQLVKLLVSMACKKLAFQARKQHAQRRDSRRVAGSDPAELQAADGGPSPSQVAAGRELLHEVRRRLSEEERQLADLRGQGCGWAEIAERFGGTPQARRMQLSRAVDRVAGELGLDEGAE
jgi:RNA polymerase sigma factor (sigma-70 family)